MSTPLQTPSNGVPAPLYVETDVNLKPYNTFGLPAVARRLVRIREAADVRRVVDHPDLGRAPKFVLGGGSNLVLTKDVDAVVLKVEITGIRLLEERDDAWIVEAGAGVVWHDFVTWTLDHGYPGLENMALIPGTVGASPVQNIGAYGIEVKDRLEAVEVMDLVTGRPALLPAEVCRFGYRDSVFKHSDFGGLAGKSVITRVRFRLPKPWQPVLGYLEIERKMAETGITAPDARQIYDWICAVRRAKLPDPAVIGNAGSFFKNPVVSSARRDALLAAHPQLVSYAQGDGSYKLAAGWLIDQCGWKGRTLGAAGVYEKQALVLVNRGEARGADVVALAMAIRQDVERRFGVMLEPEPVFV